VNDKEIRKWYQDNGMEYIPEDWGPRAATGESAAAQPSKQQRPRGETVYNYRYLGELSSLLWSGERSERDQVLMWALEDFFVPYISQLPRAKGELIRQVMNDQHTFDAVAEDLDMYGRNSAHRAFQRAVRSLVRVIANDDPSYHAPADGRMRDYNAELEAAERVFDRYMTARNS
jgi:hypothetical protein